MVSCGGERHPLRCTTAIHRPSPPLLELCRPGSWPNSPVARQRLGDEEERRRGGSGDGMHQRRTTGSAGLSPSHIRRQRSHFAQIHRRRPSPARIQQRRPSLTRPRWRLLLVRPFVAPISCTSYDNGHRRLHLRSHRRRGGNCVAVPSYSCRWPATSFLYKFPSGWASISLPPGPHRAAPAAAAAEERVEEEEPT